MNKLNLQWDLPDLKPGLSRTIQKTIGESDNLAYGHGALTELLPTPPLTALMIEAAIQVVDPLLPQGYVTVATSFSVTYLSPTFLGATITVVATLWAWRGKGWFSISWPSTSSARSAGGATNGTSSIRNTSWTRPENAASRSGK